jgi:hypothetical protein
MGIIIYDNKQICIIMSIKIEQCHAGGDERHAGDMKALNRLAQH